MGKICRTFYNLETTTSRNVFTGNGVTTVFALDFAFIASASLTVVLVAADGAETAQVENTNYTVTGGLDGAGSPGTGSVTMTVAPPTGTRLVVERKEAYEQPSVFERFGRLPIKVVELALDRATMLAQQLLDLSNRTLRYPASEPLAASGVLPAKASRLGKFLTFDATTGAPTVSAGSADGVTVSAFGATLIDDADAAAARTTLGMTTFAGTLIDDVDAKTARATLDAEKKFMFNVLDYGALADGSADSTAAIQAAIDAAKAAVGAPSFGASFNSATRVFIPPGIYRVSSLNCTACTGLDIYAIPGSMVLYAQDQVTAGKPVIDLTGSSNCQLHGLIVAGQKTDGTDPTIIPMVAYLLAETDTTPGDSNKNHMDMCGTLGKFSSAALGVVGSTDNKFDFCALQNMTTNKPVLIVSTQPDYALSSPYKTIQNIASNVGDNTFIGCEFHAHDSLSGTAETIYLREIDNLRFYGGNCDNSGPYHVLLQGVNSRNLMFSGVKFYSESGHAADDMLQFDAAVTGFILDNPNTSDNAFTTSLIKGSGAIVAGFVRGVPSAKLSGSSLYFLGEPGIQISAFFSAVAGGSTRFLAFSVMDATEANVTFPAPRDGVFTGMQVSTSTSPGAGQNYAFTLSIAGVGTALTATIIDTNTTASNNVNAVAVTRGQLVSLKVVTSATATGLAHVGCAIGFIPA